MKLLAFVALLASVSEFSMASLPVDSNQLAQWQAFFDATGGSSWTRCKGKRDSPCTCEGTTGATVTCVAQDGTNFIQSVVLLNNNLAASSFPSDIVNNLIGGFTSFTTMDIRNNPNVKNPGGACLPIPNCIGITCKLGYSVCTDTTTTVSPTPGTGSTSSPSTTGSQTSSPSGSGTGAVNAAQLATWQAFFDATGGSSWTKCKGKRDSPCTCSGTVDAVVTCAQQNGELFIQSVTLRNNNLAGKSFPSGTINDLISGFGGFTTINLKGNTNLKNPGGACLSIPACSGVSCKFDYSVCPVGPTNPPVAGQTGVPSAAPTPGASGTKSPSTISTTSPSATVTPSTQTPASQAPTKSPTAGSTNSPTTGGTGSPSTIGTSSPTAGGSGTQSPTPVGFGTQAPTSGGSTDSPTSGGTSAPTNQGATKSPTIQVGPGGTPAPTNSMASAQPSGSMAVFMAALMALAALIL